MVSTPRETPTAMVPVDARRLIAVVYADMVGYSRLIGLDDADTYARLQELRRDLIDPGLLRHGGTLAQTAGDSLLVTFESIISAVRFAIDMQRGVPDFDGDYPTDRRVRFRVSVNIGDVIPDGTNLHGDGVNIAARLQTVCPPGAICVSRVVRDQVGNRLGLGFKELGAVNFKNIAQPIEAYLLEIAPSAITPLALPARRWRRAVPWVGAAAVGVAAVILAVLGVPGLPRQSNLPPPKMTVGQMPESDLPPLSIAVLPFENLSGDPEQAYLADGISEDLTTDLSHLDNAFVISRESAFSFRGKSIDVREVGRQLGVRYLLEGSVRKMGDAVRINAQLVSARDGAHVWAERFDQPLRDLQAGQDGTVQRIGSALNVKFHTEKQQPKTETTNPTAYDLVLHAKAVLHEPQSDGRDTIAAGYFEQALRLDPGSVQAKAGVATMLLKSGRLTKRASDLITTAEWAAPNSPDVLAAKFRLLRGQRRYEQATATFRKLLDIDSSSAGLVAEFDYCSLCWGTPESTVDLIARTARLNPLSPNRTVIYDTLGRMMLLLGRDAEAIDWLERERRVLSERLPSHLEESGEVLGNRAKILLAAAYALTDKLDDAQAMLASAMSSKYSIDFTVRRFLKNIPSYYDDHSKQQEWRIAEGLRRAGLRDHLDEKTDFHIASTADLRENVASPTPVDVPGATTVTTEDVVKLLEHNPLVITTAVPNPTVPGAIRFDLPTSGTLSDEWQIALQALMRRVTPGDQQRPIVTFAYSINQWNSRNLTLRLVALGYSSVYWYRGGWEAWDAHDLPKAPLDLQFSPLQ
jgi:adenylate cyclase